MFDDVIDVFEVVTDSIGHGNIEKAVDAGTAFARKQIIEAIPKNIAKEAGQRFLPVELIAKGVDWGITRTGLDPGHEFRDQIGFTVKGKVTSAFEGDLLDDEVTLDDEGPGPRPADKLVTGWFDP